MKNINLPDYINKISFYHYKINFCVTEEFCFYPFTGAAIRGILGEALRKVSCRYNDDFNCNKCKYNRTCAYSYFYENSFTLDGNDKKSSDTNHFRKFGFVPAPFVIIPGKDLNRHKGKMNDLITWQPGELFSFEIIIFESANKFFAKQILEALKYVKFMLVGAKPALNQINAKGRLELISIERFDKNNKNNLLYVNEKFIDNVKPQKIKGKDIVPNITNQTKLKIHFSTPLSIKIKGKPIRASQELPFNAFYKQIEQRIALNAHYHCNIADLPFFDTNEELPDNIIFSKSSLKDIRITRWSHSQKKMMIMEGIIGDIFYEGNIENYLKVLYIGQYIGAGKHTNFGFGRYKIFIE